MCADIGNLGVGVNNFAKHGDVISKHSLILIFGDQLIISGKDDVFGENPCIFDTIGKMRRDITIISSSLFQVNLPAMSVP